jgi:hypothetical protein
MIAYYNQQGKKVAIAHQYVKPDGTIGGSGRPDPKWLLEEGVIYLARKDPPS